MPTNDEDFKKALAVASEQLKTNKIQIRFGPTGKVRFTIDEVSLQESLAVHGIAEDSFRQIFHSELGLLMELVLQEKVEEWLALPSSEAEKLDSDQKALRRKTITERAKVVERDLISPDIRARYLIKTSSKHPRLRELKWEIAKKLFESSTKNAVVSVHPYATLEFEAIWPEKELGMLGWLGALFPTESAGRRESLAFDCDESDVDTLIQVLRDAKVALEAAKGIQQ